MEKKYYKAFRNDMTCRDVKYQVGKTYKEDYAKLCESGFHFCENPLDCLHYYPLIDDSGNIVKINRVTPLGIVDDTHDVLSIWDTQKCTTKIKIGESVDLDTFIKESREYLLTSSTPTEFLKNYYYHYLNPQKLRVQLYTDSINITNNFQNITSPRPNTLHIVLASVNSNILIDYYSNVYLENIAHSNNIVYNNVDESIINSTADICNIICKGNNNLISNKNDSTNILIEGLGNTIDIRGKYNRIKLLSNSNNSSINVQGQGNHIYNESNNIDIKINESTNIIISNGNNCNIHATSPYNLIECNGKDCNIIVEGERHYIKASIGTHITFIDSVNSFKEHIVIDGDIHKEESWYGVDQSCGKSFITEENEPTKVEEKLHKH